MSQAKGLGSLLRNRGGIGMRVANTSKRAGYGHAGLFVLATGVLNGACGHLDV